MLNWVLPFLGYATHATDKKKRSSATALTPSQTTEVEEAGSVASDPSSENEDSKKLVILMDDVAFNILGDVRAQTEAFCLVSYLRQQALLRLLN